MIISVALCTYNGESFIRTQLESILNQSVAVDEIIILDDKSTDATVGVIEEIMARSPVHIRLIQGEQNRGAIRSFEKCIQACSGDIIFLADQDDSWLPSKVKLMLAAFEADGQALAIFSDATLLNGVGAVVEGTLWSKWNFTSDLQRQWRDSDFAFAQLLANHNVITGATLAFRKQLLPYLLPFELPVTYWHDCWIGLVAAGLGGLRFLTEPTIAYRIHTAQQVGTTSGANDKRYQHIAKSRFFEKMASLFPVKAALIARVQTGNQPFRSPTIWQTLVQAMHKVLPF